MIAVLSNGLLAAKRDAQLALIAPNVFQSARSGDLCITATVAYLLGLFRQIAF